MKKYNIAVIPLDGVGKEVIPLGAKAMEKAQEILGGFELEFQYYDAGVEYAVKNGRMCQDNLGEEVAKADAMFCGSAGHYDVEMAKTEYPGYKVGMQVLQFLRGGMGNSIGLRPLKLLKGVDCPLKNKEEMDVLLVRQLAEGFYIHPGHMIGDDAAYDTIVVTRKRTEEFAETCFNLARGRDGRRQDGKKMVTLGNKHGNVTSFDFYRKIFTEVSANYPDIELHFTQVDALAEHLIKDPDRFDVIACENMIGDIIGDIGAYITGGMGLTPTADIGGVTPQFRPNHGTFPRAVGKGFANPFASILTGSLLMDTLGNDGGDEALRMGAKLILKAMEHNLLTSGPRTKDMGGSANTLEAADAVLKAMEYIKL
ncbi:isocitrate/isopropylmalate family dehydrogenase [Desulfitobacterium chlororespirans]|uniref:Tartrate dehydrogenase/decarboxylase / D-malate dehydrogenase n=1 Tax=Desulfitobacterium chlororespirans DSM 11544 TaxID=1121395 RepID=A0A1M7SEV4_9FIRM|nr:isocitrate/isopropylmalate family dehydrogenase [Desulfitobacterium chlororespirans]SHN57016.1 tartrate dehydrogenase/decarboxylase / D-malate dehydrogenase [Desulfitobacterium chlororespirans DSM 11544]